MVYLHPFASPPPTQADAFKKLFNFHFIWTFLGVALTKALLQTVEEFVSQPIEGLNSISISVGSTAIFFMTYLFVQTVVMLPINELLRPGPLLLGRAKILLREEPDPEPIRYHQVRRRHPLRGLSPYSYPF